MVDKALKQSGMEEEHYLWCVEQRKVLSNGSTEYVEVNPHRAIEHGAFYKVLVEPLEK